MWQHNITDARYTSPGGKEFVFAFEDVTSETDLKSTAFSISGKDGAYVQSHGRAGRRFPFTCIFYGSNCIDAADNFEKALCEKGYGELQHPVYGVFKVVPTGTIKRSDALVSGLNQSTVDIEFSETLVDTSLPQSQTLLESGIEESIDAFENAAALDFAENIKADSATEMIETQNMLKNQKKTIVDDMAKLSSSGKNGWQNFQSLAKEMDNSINSVFVSSLTVGRQFVNILKTPSRMAVSTMLKIDGYSNLIKNLINNSKRDPVGINNTRNQYAATRLNLFSSLAFLSSGVALGLGSGKNSSAVFLSREEAVSAAEIIESLLQDIKSYHDSKVEKNIFVDSDISYKELINIVYASIKVIQGSFFSLPSRRIIKLGRDRQLIELTAELYGDLEKIDNVITDNNLNADEIEILPMGKEITYYVEVI